MLPPVEEQNSHRARVRRRTLRAALGGLAAGLLFVLLAPPDSGPTPAVQHAAAPTMKPLHPRAGGLLPLEAHTPAPAPERAWAIPASQVDVRAAAVDGSQLVQVLDDGTRLELTLDPMLQRAAKRSLEKYRVDYGAVVVLDPRTGAVLAMAEHAEQRPELRHLSLQAEGPAASVFKIISAAALLELAGLEPDDTICTHGGSRGLTLAHLRPTERDRNCETFAQALGASTNPAFARWADQLLRPAQLQAMADRFLFNRRLPFLWGVAISRARIPTGSRLGFARAAAGFEGTHLSPLHAALIMGAVANHGDMMAPRLIARAERAGVELYRSDPARLTRVVEPETAQKLLAMLVETTTSGTGRRYFERRGQPRIEGVSVSGKTGHLSANDTGVTRFYSWFVAAAPADAPEIVVASLIVNGQEWTTKGIIPARELLEHYFMRKETGQATAARAPRP